MIRFENKKTSELSKGTIQEILNGFNYVFELDRSYEVMINQCCENPFGFSYHTIVYDDDRIIGHTAAVPSYYYVNGKKVVFVNGIDMFIFKEYRDGFVMIDTFSSFFEYLKTNGVKLLFGVPDTKAYKAFEKARIYKRIGEMKTYILPYRISGINQSLKCFDFLTEAFAWTYIYFTGLFASRKTTKYKIEKDAETYNKTRYNRMDGRYSVVHEGDMEFFYKVIPFKDIRTAFIIDVTGKSAKNFNKAVKYILKHNRKEFDLILYVGNLYFSSHGLIKVPTKLEPKKFNFVVKLFDKSFKCDELYDISNWDVNLATYDVI